MLDENASLETIRSYFSGDRFATEMGCVITEAAKGHAICELPITDAIKNAQGGVMGGALFTLGDFAAAVASNIGEPPTVSLDCSIRYLGGAKGTTLIACASTDKSGRSCGFYTVKISDDLGTAVADMRATSFHKTN